MRTAHAPAQRATMSFAENFSLESTRPKPDEITALRGIAPRGMPIYITAIPGQSIAELAACAANVRNAGFEPVVHIAARRLANAEELKETLAAIRGEADARQLLVIGGDVDATGPFADALAVIQKGKLREAGIEEIGIGAYPEGHPKISNERLSASLDEKLAAGTAQGLKVNVVSQFSTSPETIVAWVKKLRASGINQPLRVGMAGPTSITALLRFAKRCGVKASIGGLVSGAAAALATNLIGNVGPDKIIEAVDTAGDGIGETYAHYFSFGGLVATGRYAADKAQAGGAA